MEAHLALKQHVQVNTVTSSCEICSGPHDTQYCLENLEQAFIDYASSRNNEMGGKQFTTNQGPRNFSEATNAWKDKPNFDWVRDVEDDPRVQNDGWEFVMIEGSRLKQIDVPHGLEPSSPATNRGCESHSYHLV
ncbi:hypothetical protein Tco_1228536 [Tanacetum coccineum]